MSYDGIEEGEESPNVHRGDGDSFTGEGSFDRSHEMNEEVRERGIVLEEDSDLECDIDSDEIGQLLGEAGDTVVDSVIVEGRRLRPRTLKEAIR